MPDKDPGPHHSGGETPMPRIYPPDLQPLLQSLLATLANIDFEHEREREKLSTKLKDTNLRLRILEKLARQHHDRREPYVRQLAILHERIRAGRY